jgi:hypothetical protein
MYKTTRQFALFPIFSTDMHLYDTDYSLSLKWLEKKDNSNGSKVYEYL